MKQEDKDLLLKDLCVRLPYKTYVKTTKGIGYIYAINTSQLIELSVANDSEYWSEVFNIDEIKSYLRPLLSMTDEEWEDYQKIKMIDWVRGDINGTFINAGLIIDWLNAHHFDYRGLIEKNLALDCTGLHIYD